MDDSKRILERLEEHDKKIKELSEVMQFLSQILARIECKLDEKETHNV